MFNKETGSRRREHSEIADAVVEEGYVELVEENVEKKGVFGWKKSKWVFSIVGLLVGFWALGKVWIVSQRIIDSVRATSSTSGATTAPEKGGPVSFQAHSFNDLRQWKSLYLKGSRSFKLDPHFIKGDGTWRNRTKIVFTHNYPLIGHVVYDGFEDLLKELSPNGAIGSMLKEDNEKIRIQLCFKSGPTLSCNSSHPRRKSPEEKAWLDIIDDFYDKVESSNFFQDHVEFLLDGTGKPSGCLKTKWRKWKSVWISNDAQSPSSALTSSDTNEQADNARFVVLNDPVGIPSWQRLAAMGYGRFSTLPYPYQVWEPDDQREIHKLLDIFQGSSPGHSEGFVFVSNSDPVMVALYSGGYETFNRPVLIDASVKCPIGVYATKTLIVTMYKYEGANGTLPELRTSVFMRQLGLPVVHRSLKDSILRSNRAYTRFIPHEKSGFVVLSDETGVFSEVYVRSWDGQLMPILTEIQAPRPPPPKNYNSSVPIPIKCLGVRGFSELSGMKEEFVALWSIIPPKNSTSSSSSNSSSSDDDDDIESCSLMAVRFSVQPKTTNQTRVFTYVCLVSNPKIVPVDGDLIRLQKESYGVVFSDTSKQVFSVFFTGSHNHTSSTCIQGDLKVIGAGTSPRFSASSSLDMKDDLVALVIGDSFCSNNEDYNKRAGPTLLCDTKPVSQKGVMTYTLGSSKAWIELFKRPGKKLNACDSNLLHGAYDIGQCPHVTLAVTDMLKGEAELVSIHRAIDDAKMFERTCAVSKWEKSLVVNKVPVFYEPRYFNHDKRHGIRLIRR